MSSDEKLTVTQLLAQVADATDKTAVVIEKCRTDQWQIHVPDEGRTAGVVLHHIAYAYPFVVDWACQLARGEGAPAVSYEDVHALNHQHAEAQADVDAAETLALLKTNAAAAQAELRQLSDAELQVEAPLPLIGGQTVTAQQMVQWFPGKPCPQSSGGCSQGIKCLALGRNLHPQE